MQYFINYIYTLLSERDAGADNIVWGQSQVDVLREVMNMYSPIWCHRDHFKKEYGVYAAPKTGELTTARPLLITRLPFFRTLL